MNRNPQLRQRIVNGREVRVEITPEGNVLVFGATEVEAHFFCNETEEGLKLVPEGGRAVDLRATFSAGRSINGLEAVIYANSTLQGPGLPPVYSLNLSKTDGVWEVDAKDGIGSWFERHVFKRRNGQGKVIS